MTREVEGGNGSAGERHTAYSETGGEQRPGGGGGTCGWQRGTWGRIRRQVRADRARSGRRRGRESSAHPWRSRGWQGGPVYRTSGLVGGVAVAKTGFVGWGRGDVGREQGRVAQDGEALGLQRGEGPGHSPPLLGRVGHGRGQPVVALPVERDGGDETRTVEHGVGGALLGGALLLGAWPHAELVQSCVDGTEETWDAAAVPGVGAAGSRVVDLFVHRGSGVPVADRRPALGELGGLAGWFLRRRDDQRTAVGEGGVDDVVAQAVLDGDLQAALAERSCEVAVPVILFRILGDNRRGGGGGRRGDAWSLLLEGDQGVVLVHGLSPWWGVPAVGGAGRRARGAGRAVVHEDLAIGRFGPAGTRCYGRQRERPGTGGPATGGAGGEAGRGPRRSEVDRARATRACSLREDCSRSARPAR